MKKANVGDEIILNKLTINAKQPKINEINAQVFFLFLTVEVVY